MVPPVEGEVALKFELCKLTHGSDGMEPTEEQTVALRRWAGNTYSIVSMTGEAEWKLDLEHALYKWGDDEHTETWYGLMKRGERGDTPQSAPTLVEWDDEHGDQYSSRNPITYGGLFKYLEQCDVEGIERTLFISVDVIGEDDDQCHAWVFGSDFPNEPQEVDNTAEEVDDQIAADSEPHLAAASADAAAMADTASVADHESDGSKAGLPAHDGERQWTKRKIAECDVVTDIAKNETRLNAIACPTFFNSLDVARKKQLLDKTFSALL